jgi:hypothetical protein
MGSRQLAIPETPRSLRRPAAPSAKALHSILVLLGQHRRAPWWHTVVGLRRLRPVLADGSSRQEAIMTLKQRMVAVFILLGGTALAVGLAVGAFRVNAGSENESAQSGGAVGQTPSIAQVGHTAPGLVIPGP